MQVIPKTVSVALISFILSNIWPQISINVEPFAAIPNIFFICDVTIIKETADVKPEDTGPDTKSIRKPKPKTPINSSTRPQSKHNNTDFCQEPWADWYVSKATMAEGPTGTSLQLPKNI